MKNQRKTISAYVITVGEPTLEACLAHLKKQTLALDVIDVVANVPGRARARNEVHRRVETDYFLPVNADMLLHPRCVEILYKHIAGRDRVFDVVGRLHDPLLGSIMGIHLQRTEYVKHIELSDSLASDVTLMDRLSGQYEKVILNQVVGLHRPEYNQLMELYHKFVREGEKIRFRANAERFRNDLDNLILALRRGNRSAEIALIFLFYGLFTEGVSDHNYLEYDNPHSREGIRIISEVLKLTPAQKDTWLEKLFHRHYYHIYRVKDLFERARRRLR